MDGQQMANMEFPPRLIGQNHNINTEHGEPARSFVGGPNYNSGHSGGTEKSTFSKIGKVIEGHTIKSGAIGSQNVESNRVSQETRERTRDDIRSGTEGGHPIRIGDTYGSGKDQKTYSDKDDSDSEPPTKKKAEKRDLEFQFLARQLAGRLRWELRRKDLNRELHQTDILRNMAPMIEVY